MTTKLIAKALIFDEQGRVLLLRRSSTDKQRPAEQDYPGGGIDPGEDLTQGVSRELHEEAGLVVAPRDLQLMYAATEAYGDRSITRLLFWTQVTAPEVKLSFEHDDFHWVTPQQALVEFPHPFYGGGLAYGLKHRLFPVIAST